MGYKSEFSLIDKQGRRKYLNRCERIQFIESAFCVDEKEKMFCLFLIYSGARISEALNLSPNSFDFETDAVYINTLKKRRENVFRYVYLPEDYLRQLQKYFTRMGLSNNNNDLIWSFCRQTGDRYVKKVMKNAKINTVKTSAITLRHTFAIHALESNIPITMLKDFMGHSSIMTTIIYSQFGSSEKRRISKKMWDKD